MTFKNSSFIRWVYWPDNIPKQTTLCPLFWRTLFAITLKPILWLVFHGMSSLVSVVGLIILGIGGLLGNVVERLAGSPDPDEIDITVMPSGVGREARKILYRHLYCLWHRRRYYNEDVWPFGDHRYPSDVYSELIATGRYDTRLERLYKKFTSWQIWTILWNGFWATKEKLCPIVRIEQ